MGSYQKENHFSFRLLHLIKMTLYCAHGVAETLFRFKSPDALSEVVLAVFGKLLFELPFLYMDLTLVAIMVAVTYKFLPSSTESRPFTSLLALLKHMHVFALSCGAYCAVHALCIRSLQVVDLK